MLLSVRSHSTERYVREHGEHCLKTDFKQY
jgi:hypothetical protein